MGRSNVANGYLFKCHRARYGGGAKTKDLLSLQLFVWSMVKFPDVLKVPDDRLPSIRQMCIFLVTYGKSVKLFQVV